MLEPYLHDPFAGTMLPTQLSWHCEPARWSLHPEGRFLRVEPDAGTDFWQRTHYGFQADNGHFLHAQLSGDFIMTVHVRFHPVHHEGRGAPVACGPYACSPKGAGFVAEFRS